MATLKDFTCKVLKGAFLVIDVIQEGRYWMALVSCQTCGDRMGLEKYLLGRAGSIIRNKLIKVVCDQCGAKGKIEVTVDEEKKPVADLSVGMAVFIFLLLAVALIVGLGSHLTFHPGFIPIGSFFATCLGLALVKKLVDTEWSFGTWLKAILILWPILSVALYSRFADDWSIQMMQANAHKLQ